MQWYIWLLLALLPVSAAAHPVDELVQGAYLTLVPGSLRLELNLTPGSGVVTTILGALDHNGDRHISAAEARAYALEVLKYSAIALDGAAADWSLEEITVPAYRNLELGSDTIKIYAAVKRQDSRGPHTLSFDNRYKPAASQWTANIFLQPGTDWRYVITGQQRGGDGRQLTVNYETTAP